MTDAHSGRDDRPTRQPSRRRFLATAAALGTASLAGCPGTGGDGDDGGVTTRRDDTGGDGGSTGDGGDSAEPDVVGSRREGRDPPGGTPMAEMPDLSGDLTVYSGRGEFLVGQLMEFVREQYPDLTLDVRYGGAADLANQIRTEGQSSPADVFFTVNAGILGLLASDGRLQSLPDGVLSLGREGYQDPDGRWIGTSGRVRTVPYNTDELSESDVPDDILAFPEQDQLRDEMGWAVTYGSFQGFVTVMRVRNGDQRTRQWLGGMADLGIQEYSDEFRVAQAVADGELLAGFTNHYYIVRVLDARPNAPLGMAFTENDAGSFFNVAGAGVVDSAGSPELGANFVRHLLSAEAQDYFARSATFEYPMIPGVEPIDRLPSFEELNPPDLDLAEFAQADINETIDLMREAGVL
jgi:iron(III) transport system substrate-binding protein